MHRRDLRLSLFLAAALLIGSAHGATPLTPLGAGDSPASSAPAKTAYRCKSPQGAVSYSQQPCEVNASGHRVDARDDRTEAQRQQAQANLQRDQALAREVSSQPSHTGSHATPLAPANLSGKVRQVAVGQREVDRQGARVETLRRDPHHFRAKPPRKAKAKTAPSAVGGASSPF